MTRYDPFAPGRHPIAVQTFEATDAARKRTFPIDVWHPAAAGSFPLVLWSHASGHHRRGATWLGHHLASHGFIVAALDHSEVVAPELKPTPDETPGQKVARWQAIIAARVPDMRFLLDQVLSRRESATTIDPRRIGIAGHSFGGWTALATLDVEPRIGAVVAMAPAGASKRKAAILPVTLDFRWGRDVPALYLVAEDDNSLPLEGMHEIYARTPGTKRMAILPRADHAHFMDDVEAMHEGFRTMEATGDLAELQRGMRPIGELCSGEQAHLFARGLALAHLDAFLNGRDEAHRLLANAVAELAQRGIEARITNS